MTPGSPASGPWTVWRTGVATAAPRAAPSCPERDRDQPHLRRDPRDLLVDDTRLPGERAVDGVEDGRRDGRAESRAELPRMRSRSAPPAARPARSARR